MNKILTVISAIVLINSMLSDDGSNPLEGKYQIRTGFNITITNETDGLYIDPDRKPKEKLTKLSESLYKIESIDGTVDFSLILNKKWDRVIVKMYGQAIHAPRVPFDYKHDDWDEIEVPIELIISYEGIYELTSGTLIFVNAEDDKLMIQLTGQPEFQVYPFAENKFFYKVVDAAIEFVDDNNGAVNYLLLYQNGIILQADKK
jgi:hypothetical protein